MIQPVNELAFWKERIEQAPASSFHYSVYLARQSLWDEISKAHTAILKREAAGYHVLDAGCGYGRASEWIDDYTGIDFSPDFIEQARKRYPGKNFAEADLNKLPFKDGQFDIAFCISMRGMILGNLGEQAWQNMEDELLRVADKVIILEYEDCERYWIL